MISVKRVLLSIYLLLVLSHPYCLLAVEQSQTPKKHTLGAQWSLGHADHDKSVLGDKGVSHLYGYYNYAVNQQVAIELGLNKGSDWSIGWGWDSDDTEYNSFVITGKRSIKLSKRNSFFIKLGGQFYDYQITNQSFDNQFKYTDKLIADDSGLGLFAEVGWQYRWDFGFGLNTGFQFMDMGDLNISAFTAGVSYQF